MIGICQDDYECRVDKFLGLGLGTVTVPTVPAEFPLPRIRGFAVKWSTTRQPSDLAAASQPQVVQFAEFLQKIPDVGLTHQLAFNDMAEET